MLGGCDFQKYFKDLAEDSVSDLQSTTYVIKKDIKSQIVEKAQLNGEDLKYLNSYSCISSEQQRLYKIILTITQKMMYGFVDLGHCNHDYLKDINVAFRAVTSDYPEMFWIPNTYLVNKYDKENETKFALAFDYEDSEASNKYIVDADECEQMRVTLDNKIANILKGITNKDEYTQELYFHDFICDNTEYINDDSLGYTSYGALVNNKAVCEGYSRAFQLLCKRSGIVCDIVCGESEGEGHMWNVVNVNSEWYYTDVTWDDKEEMISHGYFNVTTDSILEDHTLYSNYTEINDSDINSGKPYNFSNKNCNVTMCNYFVMEDSIIDDINFIKCSNIIENCNGNGKNYAELKFSTQNGADQFLKYRDENVVEIQKNLKNVQLKEIGNYKNYIIFYW